MAATRRSYYRVPVPITDELRQIAKIERRSIAQQAGVAIQRFCEQWRAALPSPEHQDAKTLQRFRAK